MQVKEAIILAGGLGTRLRSAVPDLPKCMAPVHGRPFIAYVTDHLASQGIEHFIFSLGYMSEAFTEFIAEEFPDGNATIVIEESPLGTGGAIRQGCMKANSDQVIALNGDSYFAADLEAQVEFHLKHDADCTIALKYLEEFDRYGSVIIDIDQRIVGFREKQYVESGYISGGIYVLNRKRFLDENWPEKFSFETDYLQAYYEKRKMFGIPHAGYFIDIGIPEDYQRAQIELKKTDAGPETDR